MTIKVLIMINIDQNIMMRLYKKFHFAKSENYIDIAGQDKDF